MGKPSRPRLYFETFETAPRALIPHWAFLLVRTLAFRRTFRDLRDGSWTMVVPAIAEAWIRQSLVIPYLLTTTFSNFVLRQGRDVERHVRLFDYQTTREGVLHGDVYDPELPRSWPNVSVT